MHQGLQVPAATPAGTHDTVQLCPLCCVDNNRAGVANEVANVTPMPDSCDVKNTTVDGLFYLA